MASRGAACKGDTDVMKRAGLAAIAAIAAGVGLSGAAEAGAGLNFFPFGPGYGDYYDDPYVVPAPRYYYYQPRPRWRPRYYAYQYEPDYYEPEVNPNFRYNYIAPPKKKTTTLP